MSFEQALGNAIFNQPSNRAYTDKLMSKSEADKIENLIKKDRLEPAELRLLQGYLSSNETKLVNLSAESRYLLGKYISWIHQLIEVQHFHSNAIIALELKKLNTKVADKNNETAYKILDDKIKTLVGNYLYWLRSGMSLRMVGFNKLSSNSFEFQYGQATTGAKPKETAALFGRGDN